MKHLIIRAPNWVGDLVMATPMLAAALKDPRFGKVTVAVRSHLAPILAGGPCAERLLLIEGRESETAQLRAARADGILLLSNSLGSAWRAFRARIPARAGAALRGRGLLLTHRVHPPTYLGRRAPIPTAHLLRDVAGLFGIVTPSLHPRLEVTDEDRLAAEKALAIGGLAEGESYVLCTPGAAFGAAKLWPPEHFAAALDRLHESHGWRGVVSGGPGEEAQIEAVVAACSHDAISLAEAERGLGGLKELVRRARLLLVGDSGPRWYAAAFDVPCVSVMGPNSPQLTASSLEHCEVVRREDLDCSPCMQRTCPLGHHACMRELEPARVVLAAERLLEAAHTGGNA